MTKRLTPPMSDPTPVITSLAHKYLKYYYDKGEWYPPMDANISEVINKVIVAGRVRTFGQPRYYNMETDTPKSYSIYRRFEDDYQEKNPGRSAHIYHSLTTDEYKTVLAEVEKIINNDSVDREWMLN